MNAITRLFLILLPFLFLFCAFSAGWLIATYEKPLVMHPVADCGSQPTGPVNAVSATLGTNVALNKRVVARAGGVDWPAWGGANDQKDYGTTTRAEKARWGNQTNTQGGAYEVVDLGREYTLTGIGYGLDWDGAYANPLTFQVLVSTDNETWTLVASTVHRYTGGGVLNHVDIDLAIPPIRARYVKYWEPEDGAWNGWGDWYQLRAYAGE